MLLYDQASEFALDTGLVRICDQPLPYIVYRVLGDGSDCSGLASLLED